MVKIKKFNEYDPELEKDWQDFIRDKACPVYSDYRWRGIIENLYERNVIEWIAYNDKDGITGFCRLYHDQFQCFSSRHGFYAEDKRVRKALYEEIMAYMAEQKPFSTLLTSGNRNDFPDDEAVFEKHTLWLPLNYESEEQMWDVVPKKTRNMVRKAEKSGLEVMRGIEHLDAFYTLYKRHSENKSLSVRSRKYFEALSERFGEGLELFVIQHEGEIKAGMVFLRGTGPVTYMNNASEMDVAKLGGNNLLMWEAMKYFHGQGVEIIDLGESKLDSPVYKFKQRLSKDIEPRAVHYVSQEQKLPIDRLVALKLGNIIRRLSKAKPIKRVV